MATVTKPIALDESFHTTETPSRNIADVLASLGDAISQGAQPVTKKLATNSFKTINGGLVDGLTVQFTPVQDLHGYDKPWAGGAGKNKLPYLTSGINQNITYTVASDGKMTISGTSTGYSEISVTLSLVAGTYTVSGALPTSTSGKGDIYVQNIDASPAVTIARDYQGSTQQTFTLSATTNIKVCVRATNVSGDAVSGTYEPMIRLASISDDSYEPYSNICPISGHTQVQSKINNTTYTTSLGGTYYGGELDMVSGEGESEWANIASYAGESITEPWLSSLDEYIPNTTPTTGAQVCYKLATPTTLTLTGQNITAEVGDNNVSAPLDGQSIKTDSVIYKDMFTWEDVLKVI